MSVTDTVSTAPTTTDASATPADGAEVAAPATPSPQDTENRPAPLAPDQCPTCERPRVGFAWHAEGTYSHCEKGHMWRPGKVIVRMKAGQ